MAYACLTNKHSMQQTSLFRYFKKDAISGLIVFLIALPLCLGIAQASRAPLFSGLIAGIIGGIVIGFLSKSHLSVSGPAAGLVAIVVVAIEGFSPKDAGGGLDMAAGFSIFLCSVMIAGALQLLLGFVKAGSIANYFPSSVIEGMLAGIGITIIISQIPVAVGFQKPNEDAGVPDAETGMIWERITTSFQHIEPGALIIAAIGLIILALWLTKAFSKVKLIPAGLLVVVLGTLLNELFKVMKPEWYLATNHLVQLPVPKTAADFIGQLPRPNFSGFANPAVWKTGAVIAIVASIETLLCIEATDKLDPYKRYTSGNAELRAQGIGNMISGFVGGLPITSVIVRSSANINSGARSKLSTIIHGVLLLVCVATIPFILNLIPKAALAAILIFTGYRLCRPSVFRHMWKEGGVTQFVPFVVTAVCVYALNLLAGVAIGLGISILLMLYQNMRIPYYFQRSTFSNGELIKLTLAQEVSFLNKASIKQTLEHLPEGSSVIIDASQTEYIDFDVLDLIREFSQNQAKDKNIRLSLIGFKDTYKVPAHVSEREVVTPLMHSDEVPRRESGNYQKLLKQLTGRD